MGLAESDDGWHTRPLSNAQWDRPKYMYDVLTVFYEGPKGKTCWQNEEKNDNHHSSCCVVDGFFLFVSSSVIAVPGAVGIKFVKLYFPEKDIFF